jgi:hypothetical protein
MKKITFLSILLFNSVFIFAQQFHQIAWQNNSPNSDLSISLGETVVWVWGDTDTHTVTSLKGSEEIFDSKELTGVSESFSHTFNTVGEFPYHCSIHPNEMFGTISVQVLNTTEEEVVNYNIYPNPVTDKLHIITPKKIDDISITNILGKKVFNTTHISGKLSIDMSEYKNGMYFIHLKTDNRKKSYKIIKK